MGRHLKSQATKWKEQEVAQWRYKSWHLPEVADDNHEHHQHSRCAGPPTPIRSEETTGRKRPASDATSWLPQIIWSWRLARHREVVKFRHRFCYFKIVSSLQYSFRSPYFYSYNSERESIHMAYNRGRTSRYTLRTTRLGNRLYHMSL